MMQWKGSSSEGGGRKIRGRMREKYLVILRQLVTTTSTVSPFLIASVLTLTSLTRSRDLRLRPLDPIPVSFLSLSSISQ